MSTVVVHSFRSLQETFEARASEWACATILVLLSFVFFFNDAMLYQQNLEGMRTILNSQLGWAAIFFLIGSTRLTVLVINGAYWRTPHFRALTAFFSVGVWFMIVAAFARNGSLVLAFSLPIFVLDAYNIKRASREAGQSEFIRRHLPRRGIENVGSAKIAKL